MGVAFLPPQRGALRVTVSSRTISRALDTAQLRCDGKRGRGAGPVRHPNSQLPDAATADEREQQQ